MEFMVLKKMSVSLYFCITEPVYCIFCKNGATCRKTAISVTCDCADGYFGDGCGEQITSAKEVQNTSYWDKNMVKNLHLPQLLSICLPPP